MFKNLSKNLKTGLNLCKKHKSTCVAVIMSTMAVVLAIQNFQISHYAKEINNDVLTKNYIIGYVKKDNNQTAKITSADVLNNMPFNEANKDTFKQAVAYSLANYLYAEHVTNKDIQQTFETLLIQQNTNKATYLKTQQLTWNQIKNEIKKQNALLEALMDNINVSSDEVKNVQKNFIYHGNFLVATFQTKSDAEEYYQQLVSAKENKNVFNEKIVRNMIKSSKAINTKNIKQTFNNYNEIYPTTVNDQFWATKENQFSGIISNNEKDAIMQRYYVVYRLSNDKQLATDSYEYRKITTEIAKKLKLNQPEQLKKAYNNFLTKTGVTYNPSWKAIVSE